jgi:hypothetical protein
LWMPPLIGAVVYPGLLLTFDWALNGYHKSGSVLWAAGALLVMLLAASVPALAARALLLMRHCEGPVLARGILYLVFAIPSFFSLTFSLSRLAEVYEHLIEIWISMWIALGVMLYFREGQAKPASQETRVAWLRVIHGGTALLLLLGFLISHLVNHALAAWSVTLHGAAMEWLRLWYRSESVEPVLLGLLFVMISTGVPMVVHHSRRRMDAFRVVQLATGVYIGVFMCSHVLAVLNGRRLGVETDWTFAAGPASLLEGRPLHARLIPHYFVGSFALMLHVACGLRVVLLKHGVAAVAGNRALYALASAALVVTVLITAALLGFHVEAPR